MINNIYKSMILVVLLGVIACDKVEMNKNQNKFLKQQVILMFGNSLTEGYKLPLLQSMPTLIQNKINYSLFNYKVVNGGYSGDTTGEALERLPKYLIKNSNIKVVVVELGANDYFQNIPVSKIKTNLIEIIAQIRKYDSKIKILVIRFVSIQERSVKYHTDFNNLYDEIESSEKITLLPFLLAGMLDHPEYLQEDGLHPNQLGTEFMSQQVWTAMKSHL